MFKNLFSLLRACLFAENIFIFKRVFDVLDFLCFNALRLFYVFEEFHFLYFFNDLVGGEIIVFLLRFYLCYKLVFVVILRFILLCLIGVLVVIQAHSCGKVRYVFA